MIAITQALNNISTAWAPSILRASLQGGLALAAAWAICAIAPRLPARARCWLWRAAYLKLLVAAFWTTPVDLPLLRPRPIATAMAVPSVPRIATAAPPPSSAPLAPVASAIAAAPSHLSIASLLLCLWALGVLLGCARIIFAWNAAYRLRRSVLPLDDPTLFNQLQTLARRMGLRRMPSIGQSDSAPGPLLLGGPRPMIVLPTAFLRDCTRSQARLAAAHEMAHVLRRDLGWCWLPRVGRVLFFFHPLALLGEREWRAAQESACDQLAIDAAGACPSEYADAMLCIAAGASYIGGRVLALGAAGSRRSLERRLLAMRHFHSWSRRRLALAGAAITFAMVLALVPWRVTAQDSPRKTDRIGAVARKSAPATGPADSGSSGHKTQGNPVGEQTINLPAIVEAARVPVAFATTGLVRTVHCEEGKRVRKGDLLFALDNTEMAAQLKVAEAKLEAAKVESDRARQLHQQNVVGDSDLHQARTQVKIAQGNMELARYRVDQMSVTSPMDGVVSVCRMTPGQVVKAGQDLAVIVDTDHLWVSAQVPERLLSALTEGEQVDVTSGQERFVGHLTFIAPTVNPATQTVAVKVSLENVGKSLRPGR